MACALEPSIVVRELNMEKKELARTSSSLSTCNGLIPHVVLFLWIEFENWTQQEKKRVEMRTVESPCLIQVDQNIFRKYFVCCFFLLVPTGVQSGVRHMCLPFRKQSISTVWVYRKSSQQRATTTEQKRDERATIVCLSLKPPPSSSFVVLSPDPKPSPTVRPAICLCFQR